MSDLTPAAPLSPKEEAKRRKAELKAEAERNKQEAKERAERAKAEAKAAAEQAKLEKQAAKKGVPVAQLASPMGASDVKVVAEELPTPPKSAKEQKKEEEARRKSEAVEAKARAKAEAEEAKSRAKQEAEEAKARAKAEAEEAKQRAKDEKLRAQEEKKNKKKGTVPEASPEEAAAAPPPPTKAAAPPAPAKATPPPPPPVKAPEPPKAASVAPAQSTGVTPPPPPPAEPPPKRDKRYHVELRAKFAYQALNPDEISLTKGGKYHGFELMEANQWWYGEDVKTKARGLFPVTYCDPTDSKLRQELDGIINPGGRGGGGGGGGAAPKKEGDATKLKLTMYAHNLAYATAFFAVLMGLFASLWWAEGTRGNSSQQKRESLNAPVVVWIYSIGFGPAVWIYEFFFGLKRKKSESPYISPRGIVYLTASLPLFFAYPTMLAGGCAFSCGVVNCMADYYREEGDATHVKGSYFVVWFDKNPDKENETKRPKHHDDEELTWIERAREKGVLSQNLIVLGYFAINAVLMTDACIRWYRTVKTVQITCVANLCPSDFAIVAKTFGQMLNFNCAVIVFPVLKSALRWANNKEVRPGKSLAAYLPLRKNIIFHRLIASFLWVGVFGHVCAHFVNFAFAPEFTLNLFGASAWVTGALCTYAMVMIYSGAQNRVKRANYEIFWVSHHFFLLFFFTLLAHGPDFWAWSCVPLLLYVADRIYRLRTGNQPFYLRRVLYIPPVMELSFFPAKDFVFREGQYLYVLAPHLSTGEWHPFTISSASGDLDSTERKEVTVHIRVQGEKSWTRRLMEYFALMTHSTKKKGDSFLLELWHYNNNGEVEPGKYLGPDGVPLVSIDGPHAAPAQQYTYYPEVMLVGAGIGLTPSSAILKAICRHKWKKGFQPQVIYFYWVVRHDEIESFRWFVNVLVELEKRLASDRHAGALSPHHYIEMNIYVTAAPKPGGAAAQPKKIDIPFISAHEMNVGYDVDIGFDEEKLMRALLNPKAAASKQRAIQGAEMALPDGARMLDIWIWNGRPKWDEIFLSVKEQRDVSTNAIGCCFCGTPVIGKDLKRHCQENSSITEKFRFDLHKENF